MKYLILLLIICLLFSENGAHANECNAAYYFKTYFSQSLVHLPEQKCIEIDITESYDSLGADMIFQWDLGDGSYKKGLKINHCYDTFGIYYARLDVRLPDQDYHSKNEMNLKVVIKEKVDLKFNVPGKAETNDPLSFSVRISPLSTYKIHGIYWDLGDDHFACEDLKIDHQYDLPGKYEVKALIVLENADGLFYLGRKKEISITGFNVYANSVYKYFKNKSESVDAEFLNDPVYLAISDKQGKLVKQMKLNEGQEYCLMVSPKNKYHFSIWKANKIIIPVQFDTYSCTDSISSFITVKNAINEILSNKITTLKPIYFELNHLKIEKKSKRTLKNNIKILKQAAPAVIKIGTYTHTKGTKDINFKYSVRRSEIIKEEIKKSLDDIEVLIVSPEDDNALINTCFDNNDCIDEDVRLNRRCDIKIVSF